MNIRRRISETYYPESNKVSWERYSKTPQTCSETQVFHIRGRQKKSGLIRTAELSTATYLYVLHWRRMLSSADRERYQTGRRVTMIAMDISAVVYPVPSIDSEGAFWAG